MHRSHNFYMEKESCSASDILLQWQLGILPGSIKVTGSITGEPHKFQIEKRLEFKKEIRILQKPVIFRLYLTTSLSNMSPLNKDMQKRALKNKCGKLDTYTLKCLNCDTLFRQKCVRIDSNFKIFDNVAVLCCQKVLFLKSSNNDVDNVSFDAIENIYVHNKVDINVFM